MGRWNSRFSLEQDGAGFFIEYARVDFKIFVKLKEWLCAAAGNSALRLAFRTLAEAAKPAPVAIRARLEKEHVHLMVRHAGE